VSHHNKTALVTGGTDGIGKEIARGLVDTGHTVIIVGRDEEKGARAMHDLGGGRSVHYLRADLSLVRESLRLAAEVKQRWPALDYLVHSAGIVRGRYFLTDEGLESNFAVNYVSRFALTTTLLPSLVAAGRPGSAARVVIVGGAARDGKIHFADPNLTGRFNTFRAVTQFCAANDVFTLELARRLRELLPPAHVTITSLKVGVVKTNIRREFPTWMKWLVPLVFDPLLGQTPQEVAAAALRLLLDADYEDVSGQLFLKIKRFRPIPPGARQRDEGRPLWELSENLVASALERSPAGRRHIDGASS
jgi:NAD(P)-dependent dehydrogenase (short-subunit alcohol dehydrogenase family)